jgi:hypothetical protein
MQVSRAGSLHLLVLGTMHTARNSNSPAGLRFSGNPIFCRVVMDFMAMRTLDLAQRLWWINPFDLRTGNNFPRPYDEPLPARFAFHQPGERHNYSSQQDYRMFMYITN